MSATAAELRKLGHSLGVPEGDLAMLAGIPAADVRTLRQQVGEALFQADRHYFARIAALSKALPAGAVAKLTEATMPPLLAARTAELLEPQRAVDMVGRLSDGYLADVAAAMDAARAPAVVAAIPPDRVATVARELARRQEWVVIGGFVAHVSEAGLRASVAVYSGEQLLRIAYVIDDLARIDDIGEFLTEGQLDQIVAAAAEFGLWAEIEQLVANLSAPRRVRLAERFTAAPDAVRAAYRDAAAKDDLAAGTLAVLTQSAATA